MNNIMTDQAIVIKAIANNQEVIDAFDRLVEYSNALEVRDGCLTDFIDEQTDRLADLSGQYSEAIEALRVDLKLAAVAVEDNYGLLEVRQGTVEGCVEQYVDMAASNNPIPVMKSTDGGYSEATTVDEEDIELTLYECVGCAKQYEIMTYPYMIVKHECEICDSHWVRKFWDDEDNKETVMMGETIRKRLERL